MNLNSQSCVRNVACLLIAASSVAIAQVEPASEQTVVPPVSYASMSQVNALLAPLEQASQTAQLDLAKLRVDRWRTDGNTKKQTQSNIDSLSRNLHDALPGIIGEVRTSPESLLSTFKLY